MKGTTKIYVLFLFIFSNCVAQKITQKELIGNHKVKGEFIIPSGKSSTLKVLKFKDNFSLEKGEIFMFDLIISKNGDSKFECRNCNSSVGIKINKAKFIIENTKKDLRIYAGNGKAKQLPYYIIDSYSQKIKVTLFIKRNNNGIKWVVKTPKKTIGEFLKVDFTKSDKPKFVYIPVKGDEIQYKVSNFNVSEKDLPTFTKAELHPLVKFKATTSDKKDWDSKAAKNLVLEENYGPISLNELKGFEKYLLDFKLPKHNHLNYYFRKRMNSYMLEWLFAKNKNEALLNKSIEFAQRAIDYRNDNFGKYKVSFDRSIAPIWPNYKEVEVYENGETGLVPGASVFSGLAPITVAIRIIANNPALWDKKFNGVTYKEIATKFIKEAFKTIDYSYKVFVRDEDNLLKYPTTLLRKEWHNKLFIYNRVFPLLTGSIPLVEALEKFNLYPEKIKEIDKVNQAMINRLKKDITFYNVNGKECMKYPYSEVMKEKKPDKNEDFTHGAFDSRDFQLFYLSNRYGYSKRYVDAMANTLVEVVYKKDKGFTYDIAGNGKIRKKHSLISYIGYIWYATYREEVKDVIIKHVLDNKIVFKNDRYDSYFIYEMLKLKERLN